jgi:hypothetical protein
MGQKLLFFFFSFAKTNEKGTRLVRKLLYKLRQKHRGDGISLMGRL